jgi:hypothetical protein
MSRAIQVTLLLVSTGSEFERREISIVCWMPKSLVIIIQLTITRANDRSKRVAIPLKVACEEEE